MWFSNHDIEALHKALQERRHAKVYALLDGLKEQLSGDEAAACLKAALSCSPGVFCRVLERCKLGEYADWVRVELARGRTAYVRGTMLTLAAALDRPEHVRILLEAGYDCNSAGMASAEAFQGSLNFPDVSRMANASPYGDRCGVCFGMLNISGRGNWQLPCATPLAAAVVCGSKRAAQVLLRWPGVWREESGVVCRAAVMALELYQDDPRQDTAALVFRVPRGKRFDRERLIETRCLRVEYAGSFCSVEVLRRQLEKGFCDETAARKLLDLLDKDAKSMRRPPIRACAEKLRLLEQYFPQLCRESWVTGILLRVIAARFSPKNTCTRMIRQWKRLCGEEGDLTWASMDLQWMPRKQLRILLQTLGQDTRLVMDADAAGLGHAENHNAVIELLQHVHLRYNRGLEGVSALAANLAASGNLRLFVRGAQLGALQGENPKALLAHLERQNQPNLRAAALAYGNVRDCGEETPWKTCCRSHSWYRSWSPEPEVYQKWLEELAFEELSEEECLRRLQVMDYPDYIGVFWLDEMQIDLRRKEQDSETEFSVRNPATAVFCGTQERPLRLMMKYLPEKLDKNYFLSVTGTRFYLMGTPLCLAAAMGQTGFVKLLLDTGLRPDERGRGVVSTIARPGFMQRCLTPVMAAILCGQEETARLLLDAGAQCDFSKPEFQQLLRMGDKNAFELAARLPGVGFETLTPERLEELKNLE